MRVAPIAVVDWSMYVDGERKCASRRRRSWPIVNLEYRNCFSIGRSGVRGFGGIYCAAVYTRRAGMRSRGDWKKRCMPKNETAGFWRCSNKRIWPAVLQQISCKCATYVFCLQRVLTSIGLLIFIDDPRSRFEVCCELVLSYCELAGIDLKAYRDIPQYSVANVSIK